MTNSDTDGKKTTGGSIGSPATGAAHTPTPGTTNAQVPGTSNTITPGTSSSATPGTSSATIPPSGGASGTTAPITPVTPSTSGGMSGSSMDHDSFGDDKNESKLKSRAKEEASKIADKARHAADDRVEDFKGEATHRISETADNIRSAGREFGADSYQAQAADYLADNLMEAADRIRAQDLDTIARDATDFARRNPAVVLGGAALLGFAAARLLKASERGRFS